MLYFFVLTNKSFIFATDILSNFDFFTLFKDK